MRPAMVAVLMLMGGVALVGCTGTSGLEKAVPTGGPDVSDPTVAAPHASPPLESHTIPDSDTFEIRGTIVHKNMEGGFYASEADDGRRYNPVNLSESFRKDGLKVKVAARLKRDTMGIHMYGPPIVVVEIAEK